MSLRFRSRLIGGMVLLASVAAVWATPMRICADPDNLPFSNRAGAGFDNRVALLVARELGREPEFVWARSRRGFLREQFNKDACDLLMGVPSGMKAVTTSRPYYRSTYVFVTPAREHLKIAAFDDPRLAGRRIGLQILEEDFSPPSVPLIRNGRAGQLIGFESFGREAGNIVRAVAAGRVGTAVVWGPLAGYYARTAHLPLELTPVSPATDVSGIPFTFALAVAVHRNDAALLRDVTMALDRLQPQINRILTGYGVPMLPLGGVR